MPDPYSIPVEPFRYQLPDNAAIKFTHGDLHRSNTIVTGSEPRPVVGIVDWEQAGWLPEYWEARKARWTAHWTEEWSTTYLPMILEPYESTRTRGTGMYHLWTVVQSASRLFRRVYELLEVTGGLYGRDSGVLQPRRSFIVQK